MDNKIILNVQKEVIEKVFELENIKRREFFAQLKYISLFYNYIFEQVKLQFENDIMIEAIKAKADNLDYNLVEKKSEMANKIKSYENAYNSGKKVLDVYAKYTLEDINSLDEIYKEFVSKYHPSVNFKASSEQVQIYHALTSIYMMGEVNEFKSLYKISEEVLEALNIEGDETEILETYNKTLDNIKPIINKKRESLPFIYEELINDEAQITNEISKFRENIYTLREMNKDLMLDYEANFNESFNIKGVL